MPTNERQWMKEYMRKARKLGKIIHWLEYQKKKQHMEKKNVQPNRQEA